MGNFDLEICKIAKMQKVHGLFIDYTTKRETIAFANIVIGVLNNLF